MNNKKIDWQYLVDPVGTELAEHLALTASEKPSLKASLEETSLIYRNKSIPAYRLEKGFFDLVYQGRRTYFSRYKHHIRFFKRDGEHGKVTLINAADLKKAASRAANKAIKIAVGNRSTTAVHS